MPLDASVFQQIRPLPPRPSLTEQFGQMLSLKNLAQESKMRQFQFDEAQHKAQEQKIVEEEVAKGGTLDELAQRLQSRGALGPALQVLESARKQAKDQEEAKTHGLNAKKILLDQLGE